MASVLKYTVCIKTHTSQQACQCIYTEATVHATQQQAIAVHVTEGPDTQEESPKRASAEYTTCCQASLQIAPISSAFPEAESVANPNTKSPWQIIIHRCWMASHKQLMSNLLTMWVLAWRHCMQGEGRKMTVSIQDTQTMPKVDTPTKLPS